MSASLVITTELGAVYMLPDVARVYMKEQIARGVLSSEYVSFMNVYKDCLFLRSRVIRQISLKEESTEEVLWEKPFKTV